MNFSDLSISPILTILLESRNINTPTTVQQLSIHRILTGQSVVVKSQTGSGKSLAYLLPLLQHMSGESSNGVRALIVAPTRELAQQIGSVCEWLVEALQLRSAVVYGGVDYDSQRVLFESTPDIVIATPGRLQDLLSQGIAEIDGVDYFILDEVDQMVDMGFREPILELSQLRRAEAQTLCFSATLPEGVMEVIKEIVTDSELIEDKSQPLAAQRIEQSGYYVEQSFMSQLLLHLIRTKSAQRTIIFCRSRKMADSLNLTLKESGFRSEAIHSDRSQAAREHILRRFKEGETLIIVATDLMARGIDVEGVTHVFNFGLPQNTEQYIHRIGRTGRAGGSGEAISLICPDEKRLLDATCAMMRQPIPIIMNHPYMTLAVTKALSGDVKPKKRGRK